MAHKKAKDAWSRQHSQDHFDQAELSRCAQAVNASGSWSAGSGPVLLTYATSVPPLWGLGLSAVRHGVPLVLAGLGMPGWNWWEGGGPKIPGTRRAAELVHALGPSAPVALVDSSDVLVANMLAAHQRQALADAVAGRVLLGAECNSWPICYRDHYAGDPEHQDTKNMTF